MNRSVIPKNWKEILKKYYNKEPIILGIKEVKYLNNKSKQDNEEIPAGLYWMNDPFKMCKWLVTEKGEVIVIREILSKKLGIIEHDENSIAADTILNYLFSYNPSLEEVTMNYSSETGYTGSIIYNGVNYDMTLDPSGLNGNITPKPTKEIPFVCNYSGFAIDLGLPSGTLWAEINLGTNGYESVGSYYKYDSDVVKKEWNEEWDLPTEELVLELLNNTDISWDSELKGYSFYSLTNENSLFLPAAGIEVPDMLPDNPHTEIESFGETGTYMIKSGKTLEFMDEMPPRISTSTIGGQIWVSVRPVKNV